MHRLPVFQKTRSFNYKHTVVRVERRWRYYFRRFSGRNLRFLLIYLLRKDKIVADSPLAPVVSSLHAKLDKLLVCSTGGEQSAVFVSDRHRRSYTGVQRKIFSVFTEAVEKHMQLAVSYQSNPDVHNVRQVKTFRLNPYMLVDYNGAFYIIGQNPEHTGLRTYSLDRFKKAELVRPSAAFVIPAGYSPE